MEPDADTGKIENRSPLTTRGVVSETENRIRPLSITVTDTKIMGYSVSKTKNDDAQDTQDTHAGTWSTTTGRAMTSAQRMARMRARAQDAVNAGEDCLPSETGLLEAVRVAYRQGAMDNLAAITRVLFQRANARTGGNTWHLDLISDEHLRTAPVDGQPWIPALPEPDGTFPVTETRDEREALREALWHAQTRIRALSRQAEIDSQMTVALRRQVDHLVEQRRAEQESGPGETVPDRSSEPRNSILDIIKIGFENGIKLHRRG